MSLADMVTGILIALGAAMILLSVRAGRQILRLLQGTHYARSWKILISLMIFFALGYLGGLVLVLMGESRWLLLLIGIVFLSGAVFVFVVVRTGYSAMAEMQRIKESTEAASRAKSQFLSNLSHELRTPLNSILGYTEMLQEEANEKGHDLYLQDLTKIQMAGKQLLVLINNILDLSRIESGKTTVSNNEFSVADLVAEVSTVVRPLFDRQRNQLDVSQRNELGAVQSDRNKVRQVLLNLLSNAAEFADNKTVRFEVWRALRADDGLEHVFFRINLDDPELARLFRDFSQPDVTPTRKLGGISLGLTVCRHFCQLLGGEMVVTADAREGSTLLVLLPVDPVPPPPQANI